MPELPEVETIRRGLARLIVGKKVMGAENFTSAKSFPNASSDVEQFYTAQPLLTFAAAQKYCSLTCLPNTRLSYISK